MAAVTPVTPKDIKAARRMVLAGRSMRSIAAALRVNRTRLALRLARPEAEDPPVAKPGAVGRPEKPVLPGEGELGLCPRCGHQVRLPCVLCSARIAKGRNGARYIDGEPLEPLPGKPSPLS